MAMIYGEVLLFGKDAFAHPVGAPVVAKQGNQPLGSTTVGEDHRFEIEIDDAVRGEIEVEVALIGAAPGIVEATGEDINATVVYNPVGKLYA
ncbi:MAG: hypothetical protein AAF567_06470 [Actinomycetota bacterium]